MVIQANKTRWNSTFLSIQRALILKRRIHLFCIQNQELVDDILIDDEWQQLHDIAASLYPFFEVTLELEGRGVEGHHDLIWEALPALHVLMTQMEQGRAKWQGIRERQQAQQPPNTTRRGNRIIEAQTQLYPLEIAHQNAWNKLQKYYNKTDQAHAIYGAAVLLHPSRRKQYFDVNWVGNEALWKEDLIANVKEIWRRDYLPNYPSDRQERHPQTLMYQFLMRTQGFQDNGDEFDNYINGPCINFANGDALISWVANEKDLPASLRQQLLDLLSIPAMSAELERVFSQAKLTLSGLRHSLLPTTIEMLELLRHWWVNKILIQDMRSGPKQYRKRKRTYIDSDDDSEEEGRILQNEDERQEEGRQEGQ